MAFRRRFRRFRGRRPLVRAQRPTWRKAFDMSVQGDFNGPSTGFFAVPNAATALNVPTDGANTDVFTLMGPGAGTPGVIQVVNQVDVDFFEGEFSVLRLMGYLRVPYVVSNDLDSGDANRVVEVRAWMYKTFEQEIDSKIGLVHPFNASDFDSRIVWSASWTHLLQAQTTANNFGDYNGAHAIDNNTPTATLNFSGVKVQAYSDQSTVRRFHIRQAIKFKGTDRLAVCFAVGPVQNNGATLTMGVEGFGRMLIKH